MGHFELFIYTLQNVAKSKSDINIYLVGGIWPVVYLSAPTRARDLESSRTLVDARQATETSHGKNRSKRRESAVVS